MWFAVSPSTIVMPWDATIWGLSTTDIYWALLNKVERIQETPISKWFMKLYKSRLSKPLAQKKLYYSKKDSLFRGS